MRTAPPLVKRVLVAALSVAATVVASTVAVAVVATPAHAATCNGYVGITFDDGPSNDHTPGLLNALRQNGMRATLFNEGQYAAAFPAQVQAEISAGMWVGNHSYTHPHLIQESQAQIDSELSRTQQAIANAGGGTPKLFRPPYGETNSTLQAVEAKYGLTQIIWDIDSQDWNGASVDAIVAANARLTNGQIILMHEWPANTLAAIPRIAQGLASPRPVRRHDLPADRTRCGTHRWWRWRWRWQLHRDAVRGPAVERPLQPQRHGHRLQHLDRDDERPVTREDHRHMEYQRHVSQCPAVGRQTKRQWQQLGRDGAKERHHDLANRLLQSQLIHQLHGIALGAAASGCRAAAVPRSVALGPDMTGRGQAATESGEEATSGLVRRCPSSAGRRVADEA